MQHEELKYSMSYFIIEGCVALETMSLSLSRADLKLSLQLKKSLLGTK